MASDPPDLDITCPQSPNEDGMSKRSSGMQGANPNKPNLPLGDEAQGKLIENFIKNYKKSIYLYENLTKAVHSICRSGLSDLKHGGPSGSNGIKCEFYARPMNPELDPFLSAKNPESVARTLVRRRANRERPFESEEDIIRSMYDLSAMTIALYHPNDLEQVRDFITERFEVVATREWPDFQNVNPKMGKVPYPQLGVERQFPGYVGSHFIVKLKGNDLATDNNGRLEGSLAEIQVKSLIMWAWQKVHHELVYKPGTGIQADQDDERLMDLSNGVIMAGEIALKQIQININKKRQEPQREFKNSYAMVDYISTKWIQNDAKPKWLRRYCLSWLYQHILFTSLQEFKYNTPGRLDNLIERCERLLPDDPDDGDQHELLARILYILAESAEVEEQVNRIVPHENEVQGSYSKRLKRVRYRLWLVCHSIKWIDSSYLPKGLTNEIMHEVRSRVKTRPKLADMLCLLHPTKPPRELLMGNHDRIFGEVESFCDEVLSDHMHFRFRLAMALVRLTWYITPGGDLHHFRPRNDNLSNVVDGLYDHSCFTQLRSGNADCWEQLIPEMDIDVESIASCPLQLRRLASHKQYHSADELWEVAIESISRQGRVMETTNSHFEDSASSRHGSFRPREYSLASPSIHVFPIRYMQEGKRNPENPFKDVVIVPYVRTAGKAQQSTEEWAIISSRSYREDLVSNCVYAGFGKVKAYLDHSDS